MIDSFGSARRERPRVREHMTLIPCTLARTQTLREADALMEELAIRHLPVVDEAGLLLGVLSRREVQALLHAGGVAPDQLRVEEIVRRDAYTASPETLLDEVCATLAKRQLGCVVVLQEGRPLGIFTSTDACAVLAALLREREPA